MVDVAVRKASAAFVHARDVHHPVAREVAGDLDVTNEGNAVSYLYRSVPCGAGISGVGYKKGAAINGEVVPGNVHPSIVWTGRVIVGPARLTVVLRVGVNAREVGPASSILRSGGLVPTEALAAARHIEPNRKPGAGWLVIQNDWIALRIGERALTAAEGETGEGSAAVRGD